MRRFVHICNTTKTKYANHSLRVLGPHIWSSLPEEIRQITIFTKCIEKLHKMFLWPKKQMLLMLDISCINLSYHEFELQKILKTTAQKMTFLIKDFFSKYDQIRRKLRIRHIY